MPSLHLQINARACTVGRRRSHAGWQVTATLIVRSTKWPWIAFLEYDGSPLQLMNATITFPMSARHIHISQSVVCKVSVPHTWMFIITTPLSLTISLQSVPGFLAKKDPFSLLKLLLGSISLFRLCHKPVFPLFRWEAGRMMCFFHTTSLTFLNSSLHPLHTVCLSLSLPVLLNLRTSPILRIFGSKSVSLSLSLLLSLSQFLFFLPSCFWTSLSLFLRIKGLTWTFLPDNKRGQSWSHDPRPKVSTTLL